MEKMTVAEALEVIRMVGRATHSAYCKVAPLSITEMTGKYSEAMYGLAGYEKMKLKGEDPEVDKAYRIVRDYIEEATFMAIRKQL